MSAKFRLYNQLSEIPDPEIRFLVGKVPDSSNVDRIEYYHDLGDRALKIEGWCDKCFSPWNYEIQVQGDREYDSDWDDRLETMIRETKNTLRAIAVRRRLTLLDSGVVLLDREQKPFRKLYAVSFGVFSKVPDPEDKSVPAMRNFGQDGEECPVRVYPTVVRNYRGEPSYKRADESEEYFVPVENIRFVDQDPGAPELIYQPIPAQKVKPKRKASKSASKATIGISLASLEG